MGIIGQSVPYATSLVPLAGGLEDSKELIRTYPVLLLNTTKRKTSLHFTIFLFIGCLFALYKDNRYLRIACGNVLVVMVTK